MVLFQKYTTLNEALKLFKLQVIESVFFVTRNFTQKDSPEEIFYFLKKHFIYTKDPKGTELFQTTETLFFNNYHKVSGAGDCDCASITVLAFLISNGFTNCGIVLVGRNKRIPVHIYVYVIVDGKIEYLDLTNKKFNFERHYPYKQHIKFYVK
jgi:hypothetical protein